MFEALEKAVAHLKDTRAGWVDRRDAAQALGKIAQQAVSTLKAHAEDKDVDVRTAVTRALATAGADSLPSGPGPKQDYTVDTLAKACAKKGIREVSAHGQGYKVEVRVTKERGQTVYMEPFTRQDGTELLGIYSYCGEATEEARNWALKANAKLPHCAFSMEDNKLQVVYNFSMSQATPDDVKKTVKQVAYYGDWLEKKLTGLDEF